MLLIIFLTYWIENHQLIMNQKMVMKLSVNILDDIQSLIYFFTFSRTLPVNSNWIVFISSIQTDLNQSFSETVNSVSNLVCTIHFILVLKAKSFSFLGQKIAFVGMYSSSSSFIALKESI
jgi:hypothetical protein